MLHDIEELAQDYASCCLDCWNGYDNYDQQVFQEIPEDGTVAPQIHFRNVPRFDRCKIVELEYKDSEYVRLPPGVINCITLVGHHSNSDITISYRGWIIYYLIGSRNMCFIPNNDGLTELYACNFTGTIKLHYVKPTDIIEDRQYYKVCQPAKASLGLYYLKFAVYRINKFNHSEQDLQTMWNYLYSGKRPKNKFLVHFRPMIQRYCRYNIDRKHMIYCGAYNHLLCGNDYSLRLMF